MFVVSNHSDPIMMIISLFAYLFLQVVNEKVQDEGLALAESPSHGHYSHMLVAYDFIAQYALQCLYFQFECVVTSTFNHLNRMALQMGAIR